MNDRLKKTASSQKIICISLNTEDDADIIRWLDEKDNKSEAIRKAIRHQKTLDELGCVTAHE